MKFKNYIWDFDGTLFDSYPHIMKCCWDMLREEGRDGLFDYGEVLAHLLVTFGDMKRFTGMPDDDYRRFVDRSHLLGDEEVLPRATPFPDCRDVLSAVAERGGRNYLYTHRNNTARRYLDTYGLTEFFSDMVTSEEGFPGKPAPDAVLALIARNGLTPEETIMVGDREIDGMSGKNAGIAGALVNYPAALPDGRSPAEVTAMDYTAASLTEFARQMGIF